MSHSKLKRQIKNEAFFQHKIKPTFHVPNDKEYQPKFPCQSCFPLSHQSAHSLEEIGVQNVLNVTKPSNDSQKSLHKFLVKELESIQVHWGQIEALKQRKDVLQILIMNYQDPLDVPIITLTLQEVQWLNNHHLKHCTWSSMLTNATSQQPKKDCFAGLFLNSTDSETYLSNFIEKLNDTSIDILLVPVSMSYDFFPKELSSKYGKYCDFDAELHIKPNVRINFGHPHLLKDTSNFSQTNSNGQSAMEHLKQHMIHEIWRNTPIMSVHVLSLILHNIPQKTDHVMCYNEGLIISSAKEFQQKFRSRYDLAFVGDCSKYFANSQALEVASKSIVSSTSMATDVLKLESCLMQTLFITMAGTSEIDSHSTTVKLSRNRLMESFRQITGLLRYELEPIYPPCVDISVLGNDALELLFSNCVLSQQSDDSNSHEQQMAKKIANNLDIDFEEEDDYLFLPETEEYLYVNVSQAFSRRWVSSITNKILDIYYFTALQILKMNKLDVIEEKLFVENTLAAYEQQRTRELTSCQSSNTVRNLLRLLLNERILESHVHSGTEVLFQKASSNINQLLALVHKIADFISE